MNKKVVFITGASSGIGKALALQYATKGYNLILAARNPAQLELTAQSCIELGAHCSMLELDLHQSDAIESKAREAMAFYGRIDILVNNAGVSQRGAAAQTSLQVVRNIMEVNFFAAVGLAYALLPELRRNKGQILVISSFAGLFGFPMRSTYSASKFALHGYFETLGIEEKDVAITIACAGRIKTNISLNAISADGSPHGEMDKGQLNGIDVNVCARKIVRAADKKRKWVFIARGEKLLLLLKKFCPSLFYYTVGKINPK